MTNEIMSLSANPIVIESLPVNRKVKKYYLNKFRYLAMHNGLEFASDYFKRLRLTFMEIIAERNYSDEFLKEKFGSIRVKFNLPLRKLIEQSKAQPLIVVDFLKFPTGVSAIKADPNKTYVELKEELEQTLDNVYPDDILDLASRTSEALQLKAKMPKAIVRPGFHDLLRQRNFKYLIPKMKKELTETEVHPMMYKDSYQKDSVWYSSSYVNDRNDYHKYYDGFMSRDQSIRAGEIHLVAKGNDNFRAVATPNRFFQRRLKPLEMTLSEILKASQVDATFNQSKFDGLLQKWVDDETINPYGIDIHHATNYIPYGLTMAVVNTVLDSHESGLSKLNFETPMFLRQTGHISNRRRNAWKVVNQALSEFEVLSKAQWLTPVGEVRFNRGQPLGLLGSFKALTMTNSFLCEMAIKLYEERTGTNLDSEQQYVVLGDDVVFKESVIGECYIEILTKLDVPLSLHKSFQGNLVEFAGKCYVRNNGHKYITDHHILTVNNLLDWQVATGVQIPFANLSKQLKGQITKVIWGVTKQVDPSVVYNRLVTYLTEATHSEKLREWGVYWEVINQIKTEVPAVALNRTTDAYLVEIEGQVVVNNTQRSYFLDSEAPIRRTSVQRSGRPEWKNTKYSLDSTHALLTRAAEAEVWFQWDHKNGRTAYSRLG